MTSGVFYQIAKIVRVTYIFYDIVLIGVTIHISNEDRISTVTE